MNAENTVQLVKYNVRTPRPAKKQKLESASSELEQPRKKAIALVSEVIVIDEPACLIPSFILSETELRGFV